MDHEERTKQSSMYLGFWTTFRPSWTRSGPKSKKMRCVKGSLLGCELVTADKLDCTDEDGLKAGEPVVVVEAVDDWWVSTGFCSVLAASTTACLRAKTTLTRGDLWNLVSTFSSWSSNGMTWQATAILLSRLRHTNPLVFMSACLSAEICWALPLSNRSTTIGTLSLSPNTMRAVGTKPDRLWFRPSGLDWLTTVGLVVSQMLMSFSKRFVMLRITSLGCKIRQQKERPNF